MGCRASLSFLYLVRRSAGPVTLSLPQDHPAAREWHHLSGRCAQSGPWSLVSGGRVPGPSYPAPPDPASPPRGVLHSNPMDYAWGANGLDTIITQVQQPLSICGGPRGWPSKADGVLLCSTRGLCIYLILWCHTALANPSFPSPPEGCLMCPWVHSGLYQSCTHLTPLRFNGPGLADLQLCRTGQEETPHPTTPLGTMPSPPQVPLPSCLSAPQSV